MNQTIIQERSGLNQFYAKVYAFVGLGIGLSALVSALMLTVFQSQLVYFLMHGRLWLMVATFAELALVFVASSMAAKNSPAALPVFLVYSVLNGFTLSFVVAFYTPGTVLSAFVSSALLFFIMAVIGIFTKKDLGGMGRALMATLVGLIIAMVVNLFLANSFFDYMISIAMVLVFSGLIAWDNQKIRYVYEQSRGQVATGWVISMALSIYLDFINLFLSILRIFGRND
ncbi:inhibitor of apoptosis-promoting Bax1 [Streptococcus sp. CM6]|uniref:Inner membrane protein YbhL n=2 Tax=Streptococcus oralis TaxID=1303 RepID=A0AAX0N6K3_STROR|nr:MULTISPECIES: Bax inhibitor-1/YccA family protein [Streptococcus]EGV02426.1 putative membrane protein [Streptococcus oralis SK313]EUC82590.1 inhibitor of apoptosis-promoting Bax1 [Streptococcus sp. CM6]MBS3689233.1 Bax inhibitor-1/YccA family protein [Streptococcus oralis]MBZ2083636.1 Bax inhibitor-1/YccA family protein [Streptococcus oralis]MCY7082376.1 Bax inhibitor-1/YccA family protein [Streptococcus oralis]